MRVPFDPALQETSSSSKHRILPSVPGFPHVFLPPAATRGATFRTLHMDRLYRKVHTAYTYAQLKKIQI
jgi:hypothetical protein